MSGTVRLVGKRTPFLAEKLEWLSGGWLRAIGCFPHIVRWELDEDDAAYPVTEDGEQAEYVWSSREVAEVRFG